MTLTAAEIADRIGGTVVGDRHVALTGFAPADSAKPGDLTFAENEAYFKRAEESAASAVLVTESVQSSIKTLIRVKNARVAFAAVLPLFFPESRPQPGIHRTAVVASTATIDPTAHLGPGCIVGENARIGPRSVLVGNDNIGPHCVLDEEVRLFPNVTLYERTRIGRRVRIHAGSVLGSDGFGYVLDEGMHKKVPQVGNVEIGDDVEIGANVTIDRGALGTTMIGRGTKIDNLVQIAHNVVLGEHCIICALVGIAGSTQVGNYVVMGGQVGIAGHLKIGDQVTIAAKSGVMTNIPSGEQWLGAPAVPNREAKRQFIGIQKLPELLKRVRALEKRTPDGE